MDTKVSNLFTGESDIDSNKEELVSNRTFPDWTSSDRTFSDWTSSDWKAQLQKALKTKKDFEKHLTLTKEEIEGFNLGKDLFNIQVTPYYVSLINKEHLHDPIRKMIMPHRQEIEFLERSEADPLGENKNRPTTRLIHRYPDRVLFLITDFCGIYCRYCTRKHFTGQSQVFPKRDEYQKALDYIKRSPQIKEVILSGGDPLTLSNEKLDKVLGDIEAIPHIELIRLGSRMPAACPMRLEDDLLKVLKRKKPVFLMSHFNHHQELPDYTKDKLIDFTTSGVQILNQMVLLNGINNHEALVYRLSRELIKARVFPYYMFQCDPSPGTEHLKTSIQNSLKIQKSLWGKCSGVALPTYSIDVPSGGGKTYLNPNSVINAFEDHYKFKGFDGVEAIYYNPVGETKTPYIDEDSQALWSNL